MALTPADQEREGFLSEYHTKKEELAGSFKKYGLSGLISGK